MLTRVLPVVGPARAVDVLLGEEAAAARPGLDLPALLAEELGHFVHAEALVDGVLDQFARLLDGEDLHRPAAVFIRGHVDEGQPHAARSNAVAVEQAGMEREKQLRRRRQHDADIHEPLHGDRQPQFALRHDDLADKAVQHPAKLRQVGIGAKLLGDFVGLVERNGLMQVAEIVQLIAHFPDAVKIHSLNGYFELSQ